MKRKTKQSKEKKELERVAKTQTIPEGKQTYWVKPATASKAGKKVLARDKTRGLVKIQKTRSDYTRTNYYHLLNKQQLKEQWERTSKTQQRKLLSKDRKVITAPNIATTDTSHDFTHTAILGVDVDPSQLLIDQLKHPLDQYPKSDIDKLKTLQSKRDSYPLGSALFVKYHNLASLHIKKMKVKQAPKSDYPETEKEQPKKEKKHPQEREKRKGKSTGGGHVPMTDKIYQGWSVSDDGLLEKMSVHETDETAKLGNEALKKKIDDLRDEYNTLVENRDFEGDVQAEIARINDEKREYTYILEKRRQLTTTLGIPYKAGNHVYFAYETYSGLPNSWRDKWRSIAKWDGTEKTWVIREGKEKKANELLKEATMKTDGVRKEILDEYKAGGKKFGKSGKKRKTISSSRSKGPKTPYQVNAVIDEQAIAKPPFFTLGEPNQERKVEILDETEDKVKLRFVTDSIFEHLAPDPEWYNKSDVKIMTDEMKEKQKKEEQKKRERMRKALRNRRRIEKQKKEKQKKRERMRKAFDKN